MHRCIVTPLLATLIKQLKNTVNTFQGRHLRKILGIHWPKKITNIELYTKTKTEEWSITIQRRRLNWLGHLMRLHPETPAKLALAQYLSIVKRPKGRAQLTWLKLITNDNQQFFNDRGTSSRLGHLRLHDPCHTHDKDKDTECNECNTGFQQSKPNDRTVKSNGT